MRITIIKYNKMKNKKSKYTSIRCHQETETLDLNGDRDLKFNLDREG